MKHRRGPCECGVKHPGKGERKVRRSGKTPKGTKPRERRWSLRP